MPADGLAPSGARASAGRAMAEFGSCIYTTGRLMANTKIHVNVIGEFLWYINPYLAVSLALGHTIAPVSVKQFWRIWVKSTGINSSPPRQNGRHFADDLFRCIFVNEKFCILIKISLKFVPKRPIDNNSALVWIMACRPIGNKPLSEPMLIRFTDAYMRL